MTKQSDQAQTRNKREMRTGTVVGDKCDRTIRVRCEYSVKHPKYGKYLRRSTTVHVHDEKNEAHIGDRVSIVECRPISKNKSFRLVRIVAKARIPASTPTLKSIETEDSGE